MISQSMIEFHRSKISRSYLKIDRFRILFYLGFDQRNRMTSVSVSLVFRKYEKIFDPVNFRPAASEMHKSNGDLFF